MKWIVVLLVSVVSFAADTPDRCLTAMSIPTYPRLAQQARIEGTVKVGLTVDGTGTVVKASAIANYGHPMLQAAAVENAKTWRFTPSRKGKSSVLIITYEYRIEGEEIPSNENICPTVTLRAPARVEIAAHPFEVETSTKGGRVGR